MRTLSINPRLPLELPCQVSKSDDFALFRFHLQVGTGNTLEDLQRYGTAIYGFGSGDVGQLANGLSFSSNMPLMVRCER